MNSIEVPQPTVEIELVTPEKAQYYLSLAHDWSNRALRTTRIIYFVNLMMNGLFVLTSDAIAIETLADGIKILRNGQHRLHAVVRCGLAQQFLIMHNLPAEAMIVLDTGKRRSLEDVLHLTYQVENAGKVASVVRLAYHHEHGMLNGMGHSNAIEVPPASYLAWFVAHPEVKNAQVAASATAKSTGMSMPSLGVAKMLFDRVSADESIEFFGQLRTGANLQVGNPVLTLRNWITKQRSSNMFETPRPPEQLAALIKTWNDWAAGKTRKVVKFNPNNERFPEVVGL